MKSILTLLVLVPGYVWCQSLVNDGSTISIQGAQFTVGSDLTNDGTIINNGNLLISGAWINNGTYDAGTGQITFNSNLEQNINHNDQSFRRLTISGGGEKHFLANITIENELDLSDGNLISENGARIILQPGATIVGGGDQSHIVGSVEANGTGDWLFPIGNGTLYLPVAITNVSDNAAQATLTLHDLQTGEILNPAGDLSAVSDQRYWELVLGGGSLAGTQLILPLRNEDALNVDPSMVVAAQSDAATGPYSSLGQTDFSGSLSDGYVTSDLPASAVFLTAGTESVDRPISVYNGISPNGDNFNDFLTIQNIEFYPDNKVIILNRWGDKVFEMNGYNNKEKVFVGDNNVSGTGHLPSGTYYYRIEPGNGASVVNGYLEVKF